MELKVFHPKLVCPFVPSVSAWCPQLPKDQA